MMILDSPALGAQRDEWEQWLAQLRAMPQNDSTVAFAIKRAESVLSRYDERAPVTIDSDYPSEAVMDEMRKLPVPPLEKTTKSLF